MCASPSCTVREWVVTGKIKRERNPQSDALPPFFPLPLTHTLFFHPLPFLMDDLNGQTAPESTRGLFDPPADVKVGITHIFILFSHFWFLHAFAIPYDL